MPVDPDAERLGTWMGAVRCRERLGGLQKCYENALMTNEGPKGLLPEDISGILNICVCAEK